MGFTELVKNLLLGGGSSIQSGDYVKTNANSDSSNQSSEDELSIAEENLERDEFDVYGEGVAAKLRMIDEEKVKLKVLRDIDAIISDAILGQGIYGSLFRKLKKIQENNDSNGVSSTCDDELPETTSNIIPYY